MYRKLRFSFSAPPSGDGDREQNGSKNSELTSAQCQLSNKLSLTTRLQHDWQIAASNRHLYKELWRQQNRPADDQSLLLWAIDLNKVSLSSRRYT